LIRLMRIGLAFALLTRSAVAAPESGRAHEADQLFREGVEYMKADNCPEAVPKFLSSHQLDPSAGTLVNLATCYARLGRSASAYRTFRAAQAEAHTEGNAELGERAAKGISRLTPTLTKLMVVPPHDAAGLSLTLNGEPLAPEDSGAIPLDPGENNLEAVMPGRSSWRHRILATDHGATIVVEVPELAPVRVEHPADWRTGAVVVGGAGVATLVAGAILAVNAKATWNQSAEGCPDRCNAAGNAYREDGLTRASVATYMFVGGGLLTAVGAGLWVASPAQRADRLAIAPWLALQGNALGLSVRGSL
jgi:hypothetical protein